MPISEEDSLYPIAVLIDELKHEEVALRLNAIHRLGTIALALGTERTRTELVPFLSESIDDEDEILLALAEELGKFTDYIGGPEYIPVLLPPLENLAAQEETVVREKAVESLCTLATLMKDDAILKEFVPMINRLATAEFFTSRTSCCGLFACAYTRIPSDAQEAFRKAYATLCKDDTPMVRRSAATNLKELVKKLSKDQLLKDGAAMFDTLASDDHDSVRVLVIPSIISIASLLTPAENKQYLLKDVNKLSLDKSWRVRYMMADNFVDISSALGDEITKQELVSSYVALLRDNEAEVRTAAASKVPGFAKLVTEETTVKAILPCVKELVTDPSQHVRASLAQQISALAPILGKANTIEFLLPLFLQLLKDEFPEVRLNIISKLDFVNEVIGIELLSQSLLPAIVELAEDKQWRVRLAIIEYIPLLAKQLGMEFFDEKLASLCMSWLGDCVFSIREAATQNLRKLAEVFGVQWAQTAIVPKVLSMCTHSNYLYRMTTLFAIGSLSEVVGTQIIVDSMLPVVFNMSQDPIPNIRFNVAKTLEKIVPILLAEKHPSLEQVKATLERMTKDTDQDVRFFAQQALTAASA